VSFGSSGLPLDSGRQLSAPQPISGGGGDTFGDGLGWNERAGVRAYTAVAMAGVEAAAGGAGFRSEGLGFRVQGSKFRVR